MNKRLQIHAGFRRVLIFYFVGCMGIVVQMSALHLLVSYARLNYLVATALSVEAAVLHNFFWHEHWTWSDRITVAGYFLRRFAGFHMTNGLLSFAGNLVLMRLFVGELGLPLIVGNALAVVLCSIFTFFAGDRIVFRFTGPNPGNEEST